MSVTAERAGVLALLSLLYLRWPGFALSGVARLFLLVYLFALSLASTKHASRALLLTIKLVRRT